MSDDRTFELETLAQDSGWLTRLAHGILADADLADDVVQDAWLAAAGARRPVDFEPRAWLFGTVANLARNLRRKRGRRDVIERSCRRPGQASGADELALRVERQRYLAEAVLEVRAPYRECVLLRFYEGLTQRAIAKRLGIPVATVHSRLARGLHDLRARLDREAKGDGHSWLGFVLPLLLQPEHVGKPLLGVIAMTTKTKGALAACLALVLLVSTVGYYTLGGQDEPSIDVPRDAVQVAALSEPTEARRADALPSSEPSPDESATAAITERPAPPPDDDRIDVLVVDGTTGAPVPDAEVFLVDVEERLKTAMAQGSVADQIARLRQVKQRAVTDAAGKAGVPTGGGRDRFLVAALKDGRLGHNMEITTSKLRRTVQIHAFRDVTVQVIDAAGRRRPDVPVVLRVRLQGQSMPLDHAVTDASGEATLRHWDGLNAMLNNERLQVALAFPVATAVERAFDFVTWPTEPVVLEIPPTGTLVVEVVDASGAVPADGLMVAANAVPSGAMGVAGMPDSLSATLQDGRAVLSPVGLELELRVNVAYKAGVAPAETTVRGPVVAGETVVGRVVIGGRSIRYRGRLVGADGTPFVGGGAGAYLIAAGEAVHEVATLDTEDAGRFELEYVPVDGRPLPEALVVGLRFGPGANRPVRRALSPSEASEGGDLGDFVITLPTLAAAGVVVDGSGRAVAGANVRFMQRMRMAGGETWQFRGGPVGLSEADGSFRLAGDLADIPDDDLGIGAWIDGPLTHDVQPVRRGADDIRLVMRAVALLVGSLKLPDDFVSRGLMVAMTSHTTEGRPPFGPQGWSWAEIRGDRTFAVKAERPGLYDVAVGINALQVVYVDNVVVGEVGEFRDSRLDPFDMTVLLHAVSVLAKDESGQAVVAELWSVGADGVPAYLGNSSRTCFYFGSRDGMKLLVAPAGHFPQVVPFPDGLVELQATRGFAASIPVPEGLDLGDQTHGVFVALVAEGQVEPKTPLDLLIRTMSPSQGRLSSREGIALRVPAPGRYRVEATRRRVVEGREHVEPMAWPDATVISIPSGR